MFNRGVLYPATPKIVHPAMAVVRDSDLRDQLRILEAIGRPSPHRGPEEVARINDHICQVLASGIEVPPSLGVLKPIKIRCCLDLRLLNELIKEWGFAYAKVHDAVVLIEEGWYMAKADLERYFNQLPLHPDDQGLLGVFIPPELHPENAAWACAEGRVFPQHY